MATMAALWRALMTHAHQEFPKFWTTQRYAVDGVTLNKKLAQNNTVPENVIVLEHRCKRVGDYHLKADSHCRLNPLAGVVALLHHARRR